MSGLMQYQDADLKNRISVSEANPMPIAAPDGLGVVDYGQTSGGALVAMPVSYTETFSDTTAPATLTITRTGLLADGTTTATFVRTITYHASSNVDEISIWEQTA